MHPFCSFSTLLLAGFQLQYNVVVVHVDHHPTSTHLLWVARFQLWKEELLFSLNLSLLNRKVRS